MKARTALLELFKESGEWHSFFRSCCETSASRLRSRAWQFRVKLKERGHGFPTEEVEDVLLGLARELLPDTAAANWDTKWAHALCKDALARLANAYTELSAREKGALDRERLLPDEKTLEKIARYEVHLSRGIYKALHELASAPLQTATFRRFWSLPSSVPGPSVGGLPDLASVHLDRGCDTSLTRERLKELGLNDEIAKKANQRHYRPDNDGWRKGPIFGTTPRRSWQGARSTWGG